MAEGFPWWVKWALIGGSGLMSATTGILEPDYQTAGFVIGAILVVLAMLGTAFHLIRARRREKMGPIYLIGLGALIILAGVGWEIFNSFQLPKPHKVNDVSVTTIDSLDGGSSTPEVPLKPRRFLSTKDKERIAEALFTLSELNEKRILNLGREAGSPLAMWQSFTPIIRKARANEIQNMIQSSRTEAIDIVGKIYGEWLTEYQDYKEELIDVLEYENPEDVRLPLAKFILKSDEFGKMVGNYIKITDSNGSPEIEQTAFNLVDASRENYHWAVAELVGGWAKMKTQIDKKRKELQ